MNAVDIQRGCDTVLYLVGLARGGSLSGFEAPGIDDTIASSARVIQLAGRLGPIDAIVVAVPSSMFVGDEAEDRLQDVAWLQPRAQRHDDIIASARSRAGLMPVGFGSVFSGTQALERMVAEHEVSVTEFLDRTERCDEWSLRVWTSRRSAIERIRQRHALQNESGGDGASYLRTQRVRADAEKLAEDDALDQVEHLLDTLGDSVVDATERRRTSMEEDADRWQIAHVAVLVHRDMLESFNARLDRGANCLETSGLSVELSGPWPPYSFCPQMTTENDEAAT